MRQRLQKVFEHATRCVEKNDFDYANQLFTQCVAEDPGNLVYLQNFLANVQQKHGNNKKGAKLAGLKIKSQRTKLTKSAAKGKWEAAFQAGCTALALNPWDIPTLLAMAEASAELQISECQLYYLRCAIDVDPQHIEVNRRAAITLERMGQFDQAIACWRRVEQAKPHDDESLQAISRLSVEKTIRDGGYDPNLLAAEGEEAGPSVAQFSKEARVTETPDPTLASSPEERLQQAITADPTTAESYLQLADIYLHNHRFDDAEQLLGRGLQAVGSGDLTIRERIEDVQLRRANHRLTIAEQRAQQEPGEPSEQLATRLRAEANQVELEIYATRAAREPQNIRYQYELGLRLKRAGKAKEAIPPLQAARSDPKRKVEILVDLGECFQQIKQYKLALTNYEQAIEACAEPDSDARRLALYRAGVLATGMKEFDRAERHLTELAGLDYGYRDVADRLDKISEIRNTG